ncbi:HD domain-containing protein [Clostridium luticellarii]|uniref:HD domain-containing protein n=1 Tax=Clostridium luticellarii TaxID=1691940 RepID=A0A2T0BAG9_9CLOT|nr:HD domain-containing protein [Clostridium luticellarii]PRR80889.1 hypothetical protein CLLU_32740 [Clostridium luticellarii]
MLFYRVKQFYWALISKIDKDDSNFIRHVLNADELELFNKLSIQEQKHSVRVAYNVQYICKNKYTEINMNLMLKGALLHDIGKIYTSLNVVDKSLLVLGDKFSKGRLKNFSKNRKINAYYNHAEFGKYLLEKIENDSKLLYLIENHHNEAITDDLELNILKHCDENN